jgi:undecaprenyl diphosphate synthase
MFHSSTRDIPSPQNTPVHVAVIMDGNGRWARRRGLPRIAGHRRGMESIRDLVRVCGDRGIGYLTLFAFSSENWRRPSREVNFLMELFTNALENEVRKLDDNNVRLRVIGDLVRFGPKITTLIRKAEEATAHNTELTLTVAANYGGRWDLTEACARLAERVRSGEIEPQAITEDAVEAELSTHFLPEPDLFVRTGGEQRISNFLLWQLAYTELYFTDILWPDFGAAEFERSLEWFSSRQRRFGQTGEQVGKARNA